MARLSVLKILVLAILAVVVKSHYIHQEYINYTTLTGYFLQDEPTTNPSTFNYVRPS